MFTLVTRFQTCNLAVVTHVQTGLYPAVKYHVHVIGKKMCLRKLHFNTVLHNGPKNHTVICVLEAINSNKKTYFTAGNLFLSELSEMVKVYLSSV
jgi:hypothetical protein